MAPVVYGVAAQSRIAGLFRTISGVEGFLAEQARRGSRPARRIRHSTRWRLRRFCEGVGRGGVMRRGWERIGVRYWVADGVTGWSVSCTFSSAQVEAQRQRRFGFQPSEAAEGNSSSLIPSGFYKHGAATALKWVFQQAAKARD